MDSPAVKRFLMILWFALVIGLPLGLLSAGNLWGWLFVPAGVSSVFLFLIFWQEGVIDEAGDPVGDQTGDRPAPRPTRRAD